MTEETNHNAYKLGLALSGGGAKGFAHIGVFRLLEECGLKPDIIVGTSVGSLMGALFADGYTSDEIKELFTGREFSEFAQLQIPKSGLFDSKRFRYFLRRHLRAKTFEELKTPLVVVATDLDNGESHEFRSGPIVEAVTASCSIPIIFSPVVINGVHYVDGGLFHNFPVSIIRGFEMHNEMHRPRHIRFENVVVHGALMHSANEMRMVVELAHELEFEGKTTLKQPEY